MFIIGLGGGLGNQMFQYAFYLSIKEKYPNIEVKLDSKHAFLREHNGIEIDKVFGIDWVECTLSERILLSEIPIYKNIFSKFVLKVRNEFDIHKKSFYKQRDYTEFYADVYHLNPKKNSYLLGVWGNEKYLNEIEVEITKCIYTFQLPLNDTSKFYQEHILKAKAVSVHVRKGDYVQYENHIMGKAYYKKAMELLEALVGNQVQYFVFFDDIEYAKELFGEKDNIYYVSGNKESDSWMDMYLMSICKHNIIANSSFSFWGAYLNQNKDKIVIAPNKPFKTCKNPFVCEGWIIVDEE